MDCLGDVAFFLYAPSTALTRDKLQCSVLNSQETGQLPLNRPTDRRLWHPHHDKIPKATVRMTYVSLGLQRRKTGPAGSSMALFKHVLSVYLYWNEICFNFTAFLLAKTVDTHAKFVYDADSKYEKTHLISALVPNFPDTVLNGW